MTAAQIAELVFLEDLLLCTYSSKELLVKDSESGVSLAVCESSIVKSEIKEEPLSAKKTLKWGPGQGQKHHPARKYFYDPEKIKETPDEFLPLHMRRHHECDICGYTTVNYNHANNHRRMHKLGNDCENCKRPFRTKNDLKRHMLKYDEKGRPWKCTLCDKRFKTKTAMEVHIKSYHKKERNYECKFCKKKFSQQGNRDTHMKLHLGKKEFECDLCGKTFTQKTNLERHKESRCVEEVANLIFKDEQVVRMCTNKHTYKKRGLLKKDHVENLLLLGSDEIMVSKASRQKVNGKTQDKRKTNEQREKLMEYFRESQTRTKECYYAIAKEIGLSGPVVTHWFMNQRAKQKRLEDGRTYFNLELQKYTTKEDLEEFEKMDEVDVAMIKHKKLSQKKSRKKYRLDQGADEQLAIE